MRYGRRRAAHHVYFDGEQNSRLHKPRVCWLLLYLIKLLLSHNVLNTLPGQDLYYFSLFSDNNNAVSWLIHDKSQLNYPIP